MAEKLKEYCTVISGYAFKSKDLSEGTDIPVIKIGNISNGKNVVIDDSTQYVNEEFLSVDEKYHIKNGDILISLTGSHMNQPNSMVGRCCRNLDDTIYLLNQRAGKIIPNKSVDKDFLYYVFRLPSIQYAIANRAYGGANQVNVSPKDVMGIKFDIPDIEIQRKSADILSAYDKLIENNNKRIRLLEQMAENLYKEWFVRFRFPGYEDVEFEDGMPKGWVREKIGLHYNTCSGGTPSRTHEEYYADGTIPWVKTGEIKDNIIIHTDECITEDGVKALTEYATGDDGTEFPAKDIDQLIGYIDGTIDEADSFLLSLDIDLEKIIADSNTLDKLDALRSAYDTIVAKDDDKEKFKVILNTLANLYEASKPEIFEKSWSNDKFAPLVYLHGLFYHTIDDEKVARARQKMNQILDGSVTASQDFVNYVREEPAQYMIKGTKAIDLSKVDVEQLRKEIKFAKYKAIEINDLKEYIEQALEQMLNRNCTRTKFSERFKRIIDSYNAGGTENEDYYEQLVKLLEELRQEDNRANTEGLTEEELEIYDLLIAGKKLTQAEEQKVKLSAKNLYKKLVDNRSSLLVVDWYKDEQPRAKLKYEVELSLNDDLPESYDKAAFDSKVSLLMNHFADMAVQGYGWIGAA